MTKDSAKMLSPPLCMLFGRNFGMLASELIAAKT